ncbi:hypothetical protein [Sorangium sp. So ce385]|uniref:hypothetical protein n=1 Tax=Sorangium sp. So ce385 TaxID=3133308 RepID=UPI003F5C1840
MALILGAAAFSAGCADDESGGTTTSSTSATSGTTGTGGAGGEGGSNEGGSNEGGSNEGGSNEGGADAACVSCSAPLLLGANPDDLCESSVEAYDAITTCICTECGAAEGDPCYDSCTGDATPSEDCTTCGSEAALEDGGACKTEGDACIADEGE